MAKTHVWVLEDTDRINLQERLERLYEIHNVLTTDYNTCVVDGVINYSILVTFTANN